MVAAENCKSVFQRDVREDGNADLDQSSAEATISCSVMPDLLAQINKIPVPQPWSLGTLSKLVKSPKHRAANPRRCIEKGLRKAFRLVELSPENLRLVIRAT
jgi:hypothetical protein